MQRAQITDMHGCRNKIYGLAEKLNSAVPKTRRKKKKNDPLAKCGKLQVHIALNNVQVALKIRVYLKTT